MVDVVALILARGGSKRIPKKNIKNIAGKPLIAWTIETAILSGAFTKILVSTDDDETRLVSILYGADAPWYRPSYLATDDSSSIDAVLHAVECLRLDGHRPNGVMLLQPTSPLRTVKSINSAIALFKENSFTPVVSFNQVNVVPEWCFREYQSQLIPILGWNAYLKRSQDIKPTLQLNGLIYLATPEFLVENRSFLGPTTVPLVTENNAESLDIDTYDDFAAAEKILKQNIEKKEISI